MYYLVRLILSIIIIIPIILVLFVKKKLKTKSIIFCIVGVLLFNFATGYVYFEPIIIRYDNPKDAFHYTYSQGSIINSCEFAGGSILTVYDSGKGMWAPFQIYCDTEGWIPPNPNFISGTKRIWLEEDQWVDITSLENNSLTYLSVVKSVGTSQLNNGEIEFISPTDNQGSKFEKFYCEDAPLNVTNVIYFAFIDINDGDYQLKVDGETICLNEQGNQIK